MKVAVIALFFAASVFAQGPSVVATAACGPNEAGFNVKLEKSQHTLMQPEPGKARVYFIQEKGVDFPVLMTKIGLDGAWVGADKNSSYFSVSVEPGEHHVCASVQSHLGHPVGLLHFTAEAGSVYYFNARVIYQSSAAAYLFFGAVDSDQGKYQIASYPLSVSTPRK
jgi:hypothetical protein